MSSPNTSADKRKRKPPPKLPNPGGLLVDPVPAPIQTPENIDKKTSIKIGDKTLDIEPDVLETVAELGRGAYGIVEKIRHKPTGLEMAVKRISQNIVQEQRRLMMDMKVLVDSVGCPNIVEFYGAIFWEGDLWLFMEILDSSLDKFYRLAFKRAEDQSIEGNPIPEEILGRIAGSIVKALHYLYGIKIIHRDVKPSNVLISRKGVVKLCDFGIAGHLVNSIAQTFEAGCKPYMAPERINPDPRRKGYDIRSDVWSLGISMLEIAIGRFPFPESKNLFEQLKRICHDEPPKLPPNKFSSDFENFISRCLQHDYQQRPNYQALLEHQFITQNEDKDISGFATQILEVVA